VNRFTAREKSERARVKAALPHGAGLPWLKAEFD
jgi:hypothetical protein